jgi:hypothetical protein
MSWTRISADRVCTGTAEKFSGVMLQQQNFGGFFLGTNETGSVTLEPVP